jgi:hypothetical protein
VKKKFYFEIQYKGYSWIVLNTARPVTVTSARPEAGCAADEQFESVDRPDDPELSFGLAKKL